MTTRFRSPIQNSALAPHLPHHIQYKNLTLTSAFQPIFNAALEQVGLEALVRITNDASQPISPERFFHSDKVSYRDLMNIERLSRALHVDSYAASTQRHLKLFLNVLPCTSQLIDGPVSGDKSLSAHLNEHRINNDNVVLEILEIACGNPALLQRSTRNLARRGFSIAIDDFGVKGSTPQRANAMNPDIIKFDRSLLTRFMQGKGRALELAIEFAREKGALTLIEGIESEKQLAAMQALDIDMLQGFYLGLPHQLSENSN